jgi:hypothetical protein
VIFNEFSRIRFDARLGVQTVYNKYIKSKSCRYAASVTSSAAIAVSTMVYGSSLCVLKRNAHAAYYDQVCVCL